MGDFRPLAGDGLTGISSMATRQLLADVCRCLAPGRRRPARSNRWAVSRRPSECRTARSSTSWCWPPRRSTSSSRRAGSLPAARPIWRARPSRSRCARARRGRPSTPRRRCAKPCCRLAPSAIPPGRAASRCSSSSSAGASPRRSAHRVVQAPPGVPVGTLIARGDVELGFQQLSELMHLEGIDVIGPMPPGLEIVTTFSGGVCAAVDASRRRSRAAGLHPFTGCRRGQAAPRHAAGLKPTVVSTTQDRP